MNVSELKQSKFLKQSDVGNGILVTIANVEQGNVSPEGVEENLKWLMFFEELEKPLVLNSTNGQIIAKALGSEESEDWIGKKIVLYTDPNVSFGGKITGGIRCRAPKKVVTPQTKNQANYIEKKTVTMPVQTSTPTRPKTGPIVEEATGEVDVVTEGDANEDNIRF